MAESGLPKAKHYRPTKDLIGYLDNELQSDKLKKEKEDAGEDLTDDEKRADRNLNKRKSMWMKKIFQNMTDVLFFLDYVNRYPQLKEEFEDEIDDLFGISYPIQRIPMIDFQIATSFPWYRLINSVLGEEDPDNTGTRMILLGMCQQIIKNKMHTMLEDDSYLQYASPQVIRRIDEDFGLALSWINYMAKAKRKHRAPNRIIDDPNDFLFKQLRTDKDLESAF